MNGKRFYRPELDVLRLVAFLLVFFDHAAAAFGNARADEWGDALRIGLPLFFVLSAYLISELLLREVEFTGTVHIKAFFVRRVLRIWPLYFAFLTFVYIEGLFGHGYFPRRAFISFLVLAGNWYTYFHGFLLFAVGILWSISVEEQFYLLWPWLVRAGKERALCWCAVLLPIVTIGAILYSGFAHVAPVAVWVNSFVQFGFFGIGAGLAVYLHRNPSPTQIPLRCLCVAGFLGCFYLLLNKYPVVRHLQLLTSSELLAGYGTMGVGCVLLFMAFFGMRVQPTSPLVYLGRISYGLYVFHLLCLQAVGSLLRHVSLPNTMRLCVELSGSLALTTLLAMLSHHYLEQPFINMKGRFTFVHSRDG